MRKTIACCIICKNEEALIARCLESVKWTDAIYVCDTGSTDSTISIAKKYTDNICLSFIWVDSFQLAQNHCKSHAKEDWILSIDSDEILLSTEEEVRAAIEQAKDTVRVTMCSEHDKNSFGFARIFRNTPEIYWEQDIHKHLNVPGEGEDIGNIKIQYGYSPAHQNDPDRALRILQKTVKEEKNPVRNLYYLAREYWYKERYWEAIDVFNRYFKVSNWAAEVADGYLIQAKCYLELEKIEECAAAALQAIKINSNFKEALEFMAYIAIKDNKPQWERMSRTANNQNVLWCRTEAEQPNDVILLSPHNDDEALFASFICMRERPLVIVVTDSAIQPERGDLGCTAEIRRQETIEAMKIAGCPVVFLGIKDTELNEEILRERLKAFRPGIVYIPALQGGNAQHDLVNKVGLELFGDKCDQYTTYTKTELYTEGTREIKPTPAELEIKNQMLDCYKSQLALPSTAPHFLAVKNESEWLI